MKNLEQLRRYTMLLAVVVSGGAVSKGNFIFYIIYICLNAINVHKFFIY